MSASIGPPLKPGDPAPELKLPMASGETVTLEQFRGRPVLVSFLSHAA